MDNKIIYVNAPSTFWGKIESKYFERVKGRDCHLKVFLKILLNSQEGICVEISILIQLQAYSF